MMVKHHECGMLNNVNFSAVVARCAGCDKIFGVEHAITVDRLEAQFASFDSFLQALVREIVMPRPEQEKLADQPSMPMADRSGLIQLIDSALVFTYHTEAGVISGQQRRIPFYAEDFLENYPTFGEGVGAYLSPDGSLSIHWEVEGYRGHFALHNHRGDGDELLAKVSAQELDNFRDRLRG